MTDYKFGSKPLLLEDTAKRVVYTSRELSLLVLWAMADLLIQTYSSRIRCQPFYNRLSGNLQSPLISSSLCTFVVNMAYKLYFKPKTSPFKLADCEKHTGGARLIYTLHRFGGGGVHVTHSHPSEPEWSRLSGSNLQKTCENLFTH